MGLYNWLNKMLTCLFGSPPADRADAFFGLVMLGSIAVFGLVVLWFLLFVFWAAPTFVTAIAILIGLVYFLSTKVKLDGDGDGQ